MHKLTVPQASLYKEIGFTLAEILIVVVLAGVIFAIAIPSYTEVKINNTLSSSINDFSMGLLTARSEATKRNRRVSVCKSSDPTALAPSCSNSGSVFWSSGWLAFVDFDGDGILDNGDTIIRIGNPLQDGYLIKGTANFANIITYIATGEATQAGGFVICKDNNTTYGRAIKISLTGRVKVQDPDYAILSCSPA